MPEKFINPHLGDPDEFLPKHIGLVRHQVNKFRNCRKGFGYDADDLLSLGQMALWKAYRTFDPTKGAKWATYASFCIANELKMQARRIRKHRMVGSLDFVIAEDEQGGEMTPMDLLVGSDMDDTGPVVEEFMASLNPKQRRILQLKMNGLRQDEISQAVNLSQSYVSRVLTRIGNAYMGGDWKMGRTINGDLEAAKELIQTTDFDNFTISNQTGVAVNRVRMIRGELQEVRKSNVPIVGSEAKQEPVAEVPQEHVSVQQEEKRVDLVSRISSLRNKFAECIDELAAIEKEVTPFINAKSEMSEVAKKLLELVG